MLTLFKIINAIKTKMYYMRCYSNKVDLEKDGSCKGAGILSIFSLIDPYPCEDCPYNKIRKHKK